MHPEMQVSHLYLLNWKKSLFTKLPYNTIIHGLICKMHFWWLLIVGIGEFLANQVVNSIQQNELGLESNIKQVNLSVVGQIINKDIVPHIRYNISSVVKNKPEIGSKDAFEIDEFPALDERFFEEHDDMYLGEPDDNTIGDDENMIYDDGHENENEHEHVYESMNQEVLEKMKNTEGTILL